MTAPAFTLREESIALPQGAWAGGKRTLVYWGEQVALGFTQGRFSNYLFPVFSPAGFAVTSEGPADHPHHHSIWIGADHVNLHMPAPAGTEVYSYNFYVNDTFQGRAPGRIEEVCIDADGDGNGLTIRQELLWRGPQEWGAPAGRAILHEQRTTRICHLASHSAFQIDIRCALEPDAHAVTIGPTRHAFFNARVGPGMSRLHGGQIRYRASDGALPQQETAVWTSYCGPVGGGCRAGIALAPRLPVDTPSWYVSDWGVMTANPCRDRAITVRPGEAPAQLGARFLVFDGSLNDDALDALLTA